MKLPINFGGIYRFVLRDATDGTVIRTGEKHNIVTNFGWSKFLNTEYNNNLSHFSEAVLVVSENETDEQEYVDNIVGFVTGTSQEFIINPEEEGVPKHFTYHFSFEVPTETKQWKTLGLWFSGTRGNKPVTVTSLPEPIVQLGTNTPTPQILDLYYTLYFDYDEFAEIQHSKNGASVLSKLVDVLSEREVPGIGEYGCAFKLDYQAHIVKTLSEKVADYAINTKETDKTVPPTGGSSTGRFISTALIGDFSTDSDNLFKKTAGINLASGAFIGRFLGSMGVCSHTSAPGSNIARDGGKLVDFGIYWPVTTNPLVRSVQNVFSHRAPSTTYPDVPFFTKFRSTGKLIFDTTNLDAVAIPKWFNIDLVNTGNAADQLVRFSIKETNLLGFLGNRYERNPFCRTQYFATDANPFYYFKNRLVYKKAILNSDAIDDFTRVQSLYNNKEVVWFGSNNIIKQNVISGDFEAITSMKNPAFVAQEVNQIAIHREADGNNTIFAGCRSTGIWRISADFTDLLSIDVSTLSGIESKCYGISIGYNHRIWALMEGGLIYSDDIGENWTIANFTLPGISDNNWALCEGLYCGQGTGRHVMMFLIRHGQVGSIDNEVDFKWYRADNNTVGVSVLNNGYQLGNGPNQIVQVPGYDVLLVKPEYVQANTNTHYSYRLTFDRTGYPAPLTTPLSSGKIDVLFDRQGYYYPVYDNDSHIVITDNAPFRAMYYLAEVKYGNDRYNGFVLLAKESPVVLQGGSETLIPRFATVTLSPNDDTNVVRDMMYKHYRFNESVGQLELGYSYYAPDVSGNGNHGSRINFGVESKTFDRGSYISLKHQISDIKAALATSGECTIAMMVVPDDRFITNPTLTPGTGNSYNSNWRENGLVSLFFDENKEQTFRNAIALRINPNVELNAYDANLQPGNHQFAPNRTGTVDIFGPNKTVRAVLTIKSGQIKLFINGAQLGYDCVSCTGIDFSKLTDIIIGQAFYRAFGFTGTIDHIQIWDKVFTTGDVQFDYTNNNYATKTASNTYNPSSALEDDNLLVSYRLTNSNFTGKETAVLNATDEHEMDNGLIIGFNDNPNVATSFYDGDSFTFGVGDGILKDPQIIFAEDYFVTFIK